MHINLTLCRQLDPNNTSDLCNLWKWQEFAYHIENKVQPFFFTLGIVGNLLTALVFYKMSMSRVVKILLLSLCTTDFLTSLFGFLSVIWEVIYFDGDIPYGKWSSEILQCFIMYKVFLMFMGMSSILIVITSVVRTHTLRYPLKSRATITPKFVIKLIAATLSTFCLLFLPTLIYAFWKACFNDLQQPMCVDFFTRLPQADKARLYFSLFAILLGPGTVIANTICFTILKITIRKSTENLKSLQNVSEPRNPAQQNQARKGNQMNRMVLLVLMMNTICIAPSCAQVIALIINPRTLIFNKYNVSVVIIDCVAEAFLSILPSYNLIIYMITHKDFRAKFLQVILRCQCNKSSPYATPNWTPKNPTPKGNTPNTTPRSKQKDIIMNTHSLRRESFGSLLNGGGTTEEPKNSVEIIELLNKIKS